MFRKFTNVVIAGAAVKLIYDLGYEEGRKNPNQNKNNFFKNLQDKTLQSIENQLPPEHKADFRKDVLHAKHEWRKATNEVREIFGLGPK